MTDVGDAWSEYYRPGMSDLEAKAFQAGFRAGKGTGKPFCREGLAEVLRTVSERLSIRPWSTGVEATLKELAEELSPPTGHVHEYVDVTRGTASWEECACGTYRNWRGDWRG